MASLNHTQRSQRLAIRVVDERLAQFQQDNNDEGLSVEDHNCTQTLTQSFDDILKLSTKRGRPYYTKTKSVHNGKSLLKCLQNLGRVKNHVKVMAFTSLRVQGRQNLQPDFLKSLGWNEGEQWWSDDTDETSLLHAHFGIQTPMSKGAKNLKRKHQRTNSLGSRSSKRLRGQDANVIASPLSSADELGASRDASYEPSIVSTRNDNEQIVVDSRATISPPLDAISSLSDEGQTIRVEAAKSTPFAFPSANDESMHAGASRRSGSGTAGTTAGTTAATAHIAVGDTLNVKQTAADNTPRRLDPPSAVVTVAGTLPAVGVSTHTLIPAFAELRRRTQHEVALFIATVVGHEAFLHFDAAAAIKIRPLMLHVCGDAHAALTMTARILLPSLVSYLMYDFVFQRQSPLEWIKIDHLFAQTARTCGFNADDFARLYAFNRMNDPAYQDEELDLHLKKALRFVFETILNHLQMSDIPRPADMGSTIPGPPEDINNEYDQDQKKIEQHKKAWQQLREALKLILQDLVGLRMRMDVDVREFQVFWPDGISTVKLPSDDIMGNGDECVEGERRVKAVMFPGVRMRGEAGTWKVLYKAAVCLASVA